MFSEILRNVEESGLGKTIEVTYWADKPDSPMVTDETKHWISVGIGTALVKKPPAEESKLLDALAHLRTVLGFSGFQFADFDNRYWFVVTGRTRTDQQLIDFEPCEGDYEIACRTVKVVITRSQHTCLGMGGKETVHIIPKGTRARFDKALVEGQWGSFYCCADCIEKYMASEDM